MPFANDYANFADCVRQNPQARDPNAYCASIQARTENKLAKAVRSASHLNQAVRLALSAVMAKHQDKQGSTAHHKTGKPRAASATIQTRESHEHPTRGVTHQHPTRGPKFTDVTESSDLHSRKVNKRDPVKEEGDKKLKEADGVAADGAQDDQAFAVAFGPDNYDKLTKRIMLAPYRQAYQAAGAIVKALENKAMNFPGDLEDHLKKAHAAIHGREMWDARYGDVCDLLKRARKLLHDIEKTAEVSQGAPQVMGKADPVDKADPITEAAKRVSASVRGLPEAARRAGWKPKAGRPGAKKALRKLEPQDYPFAPGAPRKKTAAGQKPVTPQVAPGPELGTTPLGMPPKKPIRPNAFMSTPSQHRTLPGETRSRRGAPVKQALRKAVAAAARQARG